MAVNTYGFDFLRTEHTLDNEGQPKSDDIPPESLTVNTSSITFEDPVASLAASVAHKPDLEKQFDVIAFLQAHRSAGCLAPSVIYKATGIDLDETDESVAKMLQSNMKIRVEQVPDPENPSIMIATYAYQAKYNHVRDRKSLLAQINRCKNGVPMRDLLDAYDGVEEDLAGLITAGEALAVANTEDKDKILFPRGDAFLVELDGITTVPVALSANSTNGGAGKTAAAAVTTAGVLLASGGNNGDSAIKASAASAATNATTNGGTQHLHEQVFVVQSDVNPTKQIRRGEAVNVGGQWFRVSSAVKEGVPLSEQPVRAQAPLSVVSLTDLNKRNEQDGYIRPFNTKSLPLDAALSTAALDNLRKSKEAWERLHKLAHGRAGGVASQLLGSNAHASNPTTLAKSFSTAAGGNAHSRKRPTSSKIHNNTAPKDRRKAELAAQEAASNPALSTYSHARRHGCTRDVREMYLNTRKFIPDGDNELHKLLLEHKLLEQDEEMRRPRLAKKANVDNDGKPKKRRYYERKNQRMTNTHLEGTEIGAVLRRATEKQKQGKSVGDGGM